jgi:hypothetical protein
MQKENFYIKNHGANKILKMFYEAYMIFNFTFYLIKNREFYDEKKVGLFWPMPPGLGLNQTKHKMLQ